MNKNLLLITIATTAAFSFNCFAGTTSTGTVKLEVPVQTIITPIVSDSLDFGTHPESYFQEPRTLSANEDVFSNVTSTTGDLCLTASFPKYSSSEDLPYLSPEGDSSGFNTPIYLSKVDYTTCGSGAQTFSLIDSASGTKSVTLPAASGITESACMGSSGTPGHLSVATLPVSTTGSPLLGGAYTSTIDLSVAAGNC